MIRNVFHKVLFRWGVAAVAVAALFLSACSSQTESGLAVADLAATAESHEYVFSLDIEADTTVAELEQRYDATVRIFHPAEGFAILTSDSHNLSTLGMRSRVFRNGRKFAAPMVRFNESGEATNEGMSVSSEGISAWSDGMSAWSDGMSAWSDGMSAWSDGMSAWSDGMSAWSDGMSAWSDGLFGEIEGMSAWSDGMSAWSDGAEWNDGFKAWAGGMSAWSDGMSAWSDGMSAWSDGMSAWSDGMSAWSDAFGNGLTPEGTAAMANAVYWDNIGLAQAHQSSEKLGSGAIIAVIDTGIDLEHIMFQGRLTPPATWRDFIDGDRNPQEVYDPESSNLGFGHGTAVAGVALQIAPRAKIMPIRVLDNDGVGDTDDIAMAINWAVANGAHIINMSLGAIEEAEPLRYMVDYATNKGVIVVTSAGNTSSTTLTYPAQYSAGDTRMAKRTVSVGSADIFDKLSFFSNHGEDLEILAPGQFVYTAFPGNMFTFVIGTSFAAPATSGSIALAGVEKSDTIGKNALAQGPGYTADNVDAMNHEYIGMIGEGRVNVAAFFNTTKQGR